jgi:hypothetical protein
MSIITTDYGMIKPPPGCQIDYGHPINAGLVGYWLFNEKGGTRLNDYSGYGNHGTLTNFAFSGSTSNWVGSPMGGALNWDGSNDLITINNFNVGTRRTYSFWVNATTLPSGGNLVTIIGKRLVGATNEMAIYMNSSGQTRFILYGGSSPLPTLIVNSTSTTGVVTGKWNHIVWTYDNITVNTYLNGRLDKSTAVAGTPYNSTEIYNIGNEGDGTRVLNGSLDQMIWFGRAITATEVSQLYSTPNIGLLSPTYYTIT